METIRTDWPKRQLLDLRGGLDNALSIIRKNTEAIERELTSPSRLEYGVYISRLESLGVAHGVKAVLSIGDGDEWSQFARSLEFSLGAFRVSHALGFPNPAWQDTNKACLLFCTALALQSRPVVTWLGDLLLTSYKEEGPLSGWATSPFEPFALYLAGLARGDDSIQVEKADVLPDYYDPLIEARDLPSTQEAIAALVLERVRLVSPSYGEFPPFEWSPFDLFPVDILAFLMVEHSGIPRFDFGALESPLCDPPLPFPFTSDPLVDRVIDRVKGTHSVADVSWSE